jgi:Sulfotransferase domain
MKQPLIVVCTHHKTGSVWMANIFRAIKRQEKLHLHAKAQVDLPPETDIFLQDHSKVDLKALQTRFPKRGVRAVHVIRDPRDVVISGCFYHVKTVEKWANNPKKDYGGKSYKQAINSLATDHEKLLFEMDHAAGKTIREMLAWDYTQKDLSFEARYEDLIADREMKLFRPMMGFLGFEGERLDMALKFVAELSLFGGAAGSDPADHIRSGESRQWVNVFTPELKAAFTERFPGALQRLGYEAGDSW